MKSAKETHRAVWLVAVILLFALALAKFAYEDRVGFDYPINDLIAPWVSAKAFLDGKNPFSDKAEFDKLWAEIQNLPQGEHADYGPILKRNPMVYPPTTLAVVAPLTLLHWKTAVYVYLVGSAGLFVTMLLVLAGKLPIPWSDPGKLYLIAFGLAMIPFNSGIRESNIVTLVVACLGLGVILMARRPYLAGIALACGMCLKPQVAFLFFAYPWLRRRWKTAVTGLAVWIAVFAGSLLWMHLHNIDGLRAYRDAVAGLSSTDSDTSFYQPSPNRYSMINLQVLAYQFTHNPELSNALSWALFLVLAGASAYFLYTRGSEKYAAAGVAMASVLTLFPVYQRIYNASILIFVLYWAVENWPLRRAKAALLLMLPLLVPLFAIARSGAVAAFVSRRQFDSSFLWNAVIMPHLIWADVLLALILASYLYTARNLGDSDPEKDSRILG